MVQSSSTAFQRKQSNPGDKQGSDLQGLRVLVAEDFPDARRLLDRFLSPAGAFVEFAEDGCEAVHKGLRHPFDVVLMDLQMPVMDGVEASRALRSAGFRGRIIALSAQPMPRSEDRESFDGYLSKPIDRRALISVLAHGSTESWTGSFRSFRQSTTMS